MRRALFTFVIVSCLFGPVVAAMASGPHRVLTPQVAASPSVRPSTRPSPVRAQPPPTTAVTTTTISEADVQLVERTVLLQAVARQQAQERALREMRPQAPRNPVVTTPAPTPSQVGPPSACSTPTTTDTTTVEQCIKACESGNYTEGGGDAEGAYQYEGSTWRVWSRRWADAVGYTGDTYSHAAAAPPWMQDAVTTYTLTHGGAHNWDPRYGRDPCTVNLP